MKKSGLADSPFFIASSSKVMDEDENGSTERITERSEKRTDYRTEKRSDDFPVKRRTKRYSFEFYEDQLIKFVRRQTKWDTSGSKRRDTFAQAYTKNYAVERVMRYAARRCCNVRCFTVWR